MNLDLSTSSTQGEIEKQTLVLRAEEQEILDRQLNGIQNEASRRKLGPWTYATKWDNLVLILSSFLGITAGAANPLLVVC